LSLFFSAQLLELGRHSDAFRWVGPRGPRWAPCGARAGREGVIGGGLHYLRPSSPEPHQIWLSISSYHAYHPLRSSI